MQDAPKRRANGTFEKGSTGNPRGKPPGAKSWSGRLREDLRKESAALLAVLVARAKAGDVQAARLIIDRTLAPLRPGDDPVRIPLSGTLAEQAQQVMQAAAEGRITPGQASDLLAGLSHVARLVEVADLQARLEAVEAAQRTARGTTIAPNALDELDAI